MINESRVVHVAVNQVTDVGHHGNLRVDECVLSAEAADVEAGGVKTGAGFNRVDPRCRLGCLLAQVRGHPAGAKTARPPSHAAR